MGCCRWDSGKCATVISVTLSTTMLIICLTLVSQMRQDMSNLYTEFMDDMQEFNVIYYLIKFYNIIKSPKK